MGVAPGATRTLYYVARATRRRPRGVSPASTVDLRALLVVLVVALALVVGAQLHRQQALSLPFGPSDKAASPGEARSPPMASAYCQVQVYFILLQRRNKNLMSLRSANNN